MPSSSQNRGVFVVCLLVVSIGVIRSMPNRVRIGCMPNSCQYSGVFVVCLVVLSIGVYS